MSKNITTVVAILAVAVIFAIGVYAYSVKPAIMCALTGGCAQTFPATITVYCAGSNCSPQTAPAGAGTLIKSCYRTLDECRTNLADPKITCQSDQECAPATCCHPTACINVSYKTVCNQLCTQGCTGPLDCGAGSCQCVDNQCAVGGVAPAGSI